jgi:hypothetical protein
LIALGVGISLRSSRGAPPSSLKTAAPSTISLHVQATPPEAKVRIDDKEFDSSSVSLTLPEDDRAHQIVVYADGFVSDSRSLTFDKSLSLEVALHASEPAAAEASATSNPSSSSNSGSHSRTAQSVVATGARRTLPSTAPPTATAAQNSDCNPPYYFDHGIKTYKPACL